MQMPVMMMVEIADVNELASIDRGITEACRRFPSAALQKVVDLVERQAEAQDPGRLRRKSTESRTLWLACGCAEFARRRYEDALEEKSYMLFDLRVGLKPRERVSAAARTLFANLASISPSYERARQQIEILWGEAPSTTAIWDQVQAEGASLGALVKDAREGVFERGELPGADIPPRDFVAVETDSTMVDAWHVKAGHHEIYVGTAYDGKAYRGKTCRPETTNQIAVTSLDGAQVFGQDLFVATQRKYNVCEARVLHYASDGDDALETIRQTHFYRAEHQLDHCHVTSKAYDAYGFEYRDEADEILGHIFGEKRDEFEAAIAADMRRYPSLRTRLSEYRDYILQRWSWIFVVRRLRKSNPHLEIPAHISGTGADERMVGALVGHRMKDRGMGWTKDGAANIMRVRLRTLGLQSL